MGIILNIIASLIKWALLPLAFLIGAAFSLSKGEFMAWQKDLAISKDRYGNVLCKYMANATMITNQGYKFGNGKETISSAIGKNVVRQTLTWFGRLWNRILEKLEKQHSLKSIDNNV